MPFHTQRGGGLAGAWVSQVLVTSSLVHPNGVVSVERQETVWLRS